MKSLPTQLKIVLFFLLTLASLYADSYSNGSCGSADLISELNNQSSTISHNETGSVHESYDENDYYYFNISTSATVSVSYSSSDRTDFYFDTSCGPDKIMNNGTSANDSISVDAGDRVYIRVKAEERRNINYSINLTFTPSVTDADLSITKSVNNSTPEFGDRVTFTIVGRNNGSDTTEIRITDTLSAEFTNISASENRSSFNCNINSNTVTCDGSRDFDTNDNVTVTIEADVNGDGVINNTATIESTEAISDSNLNNNSDTATITVTPPNADLSITKSVNDSTPLSGERVTFTIVGRNNGDTSTRIKITDTLPSEFTNISASENRSSFSCDVNSNTVTCDGSRYFDTNDNVTVTIEADVTGEGDISNSAVIESDSSISDSNTNNNSDTAIVTLPIIPQTPPEMGNIPNQSATAGTYFELDVSSYVTLTNQDPILSYSLTGDLPSWLLFNSTSGILSGTPTVAAEAITFSVTATDNDGESNSDSFSVTVSPPLTETFGGRDFSQRTQHSLFGDVKVIGNTVLCILNNGECLEPSNSNSNTDTNLQKAPSSYSTLTLPSNATVEYARIYWQGRKYATSSNLSWDSASKTAAGKISLRKGDSGDFTELTADIKDFDSTESRNHVRVYSASADAASVVDGGGTYYIDTDSFYTATGEMDNQNPDDGLGAYGAWVLVVIYKDPDETKARNITIFDGYKKVTSSSGNVDVSVSGFLTPKSGEVDSTTYVFTAEGDKYLQNTGDVIKMAGATYNTTLQTLGTFDSRVDVAGTRSPNLNNNNGIDIHKYDTGTTSGARDIITTNETGAEFRFTSDQDTYFPSLIVFSTQLYLPQLCYDYSIKQDGHYLDIDRDAYPIARLDSTLSSSDLEIVVFLKNREADIIAQGIAIKADVNDSRFGHVGNIFTSNKNGSTLIDRGAPSSSSTLCDYNKNGDNSADNTGCTNGHDIRKGNGSLDAGDYIFTKYKLQPKGINSLQNIDEPLGLSLKYYIVAGGTKIEYPDYILGSQNVPLCPPTASYQPAWGNFNVVRSGQSGNIKNNLYTQISRKSFDSTVVFDSSPLTGDNEAPISDVNTTVLVEIIDVGAFGDINASCANPDSSLSTPIFVPINFTNASYQANLATQSSDYFNFAVKNAAFRVWYFNHNDGTLIQNWSASTTNSNKTLLSITDLYQSDTHTQCASSCSIESSSECFTCIKERYAQPLCSRDNFSVRPESYDLGIYDINQSLPAYDINSDPSNIKNTTKNYISDDYGYDTASAIASGRMKLASGYNYRFDITSTGHDGISLVPGYTRYFNGADEYNATILWDPQSAKTGCNDISDINLAFYVANGIMQNSEKSLTEVGEYKINIIDNSWTSVDWQNLTHHDTTSEGGFLSGDDCITGSTTSIAVSGKHGCKISTNHGSDGGGRTYKDHDIEFLAYKFDMSTIIPSHGENNSTVFNANTFLYMSDVLQNEEMSFHLKGAISAVGYDNSSLSNFVDNCYAKPIDITLNKTAIIGSINYKYRFHNSDISANEQNGTFNSTTGTISLGSNDFNKSNNGSVNTVLNLNFDRNVTNFSNPQELSFSTYDSNCSTPSSCSMNADLTTKTTQGTLNLNHTIKHYYGRSHASRQRYKGDRGTANIFYEVYCFGIVDGNTCNKTLLQNGVNSKRVDDIRWFINENHTANGGNAGTVTQKYGLTRVNASGATSGNHPDDSTLMIYDQSRGYPYKTTMENNASIWLIYNRDDQTATRNSFSVEFEEDSSNWSGLHDTNTTTKDVGTANTNRRLMW